MDPEKLNSIYSKVVCSPTITRQNLSRKILMTPTTNNENDEDDGQFFESLKKKINTDSLKHLQKRHELKKSCVTRKKKKNFHEEFTNVIKHLKETTEHKNYIEVDSIKLHFQTKKICEDNITYNSNTEQSVNVNLDSECYMLPRNYTITFESEKASTDEEDNRSKFMRLNSMNKIKNDSIK